MCVYVRIHEHAHGNCQSNLLKQTMHSFLHKNQLLFFCQYNLSAIILFPFQTEETEYVNGRFSSKIRIAPEENVTLTCIAENQLERTVTSLNVSASKYVLKKNKMVKARDVIISYYHLLPNKEVITVCSLSYVLCVEMLFTSCFIVSQRQGEAYI